MMNFKSSIGRKLLVSLIIGSLTLFVLACDSSSSVPGITSLTVTVGAKDYTATISGTNLTVNLDAGEALPTSVTVKTVVLTTDYTGLADGENLSLTANADSTEATAEIVITAKDETTKTWKLTVVKASS